MVLQEQRRAKAHRYRDLLTQREYMKLMAANAVNRYGDSIDMIAFSLMVYQLTGSASWVAVIFGVNALPSILFQPFAGAIVEGMNKRYVMAAADIGRGLAVAATAILFMLGLLQPWLLLLLTFMNSTLESLRIPAGLAIIPRLLQKSMYPHGIAFNTTLKKMMELIGLGSAAAIIGMFGLGTAILIDAATFIISAALILGIDSKETSISGRLKLDMIGYMHTLKEGFDYLSNTRTVFTICLLGGAIGIFLIPINSMMAPYTTDFLGLSANGMSAAGISSTIGLGLGAILFPYLRKTLSSRILFISGGVVIGACYLIWVWIAAYADQRVFVYTLLIITMLVFGFFASFVETVIGVSFMEHIEEAYLSRVGAIFNAIASVTIPLGSMLIAAVMTELNLLQLFGITGIFTILLFVGMLFIKTLRQL
ncbi:MFS transporter [Paenibacillus sp. FSL R5-0810]|uniref:MFS transporter n=1 Tax=Paenibacillus sp. FSL R5-0810 TaxID=2921659 RepID=UPI0030F9D871